MKNTSFHFIQFVLFLLVLTYSTHSYAMVVQALSGRVYEGQTGTEQLPIGDAIPLSGVTVTLYGSNNQDQQGASIISTTITDANGWYGLQVRGAYDFFNIVQINLSGYTDSGATSVGGTVKSSNWIQYRYEDIFIAPVTMTGNKFWDKQEGGEPTNNPPIADADGPYTGQLGQSITLDGSGSFDPDPNDSIISYEWDLDNDGQYNDATGTNPSFNCAAVGLHTIGLRVTDTHGVADTDASTVEVQEKQPPERTGILEGYKRDADTEEGLENWRIYIDLNDNKQWDENEPSDITDSTGYYQIPDLEPGTYRVCEEMQDGWEPEGGDSACVEGIEVIESIITTQDFHNRRIQQPGSGGSIRGMKYNDLNGNGQKDPNEHGMSGWMIYLDSNDNGRYDEGEPQTSTDENGNYDFIDLTPGIYRIREVNQPGWKQTDPTVNSVPGVWLLELEEGQNIIEINFGNYQEEIPAGQNYISDVCFNIEITTPTGAVEKLTLTGPMTQRVFIGPNGEASDTGQNGLEEVATELVSLNLSGISPSLGPIKLSLNSNFSSKGKIEERANNTFGVLDIPPFTPTGNADSILDVFFQVEISGTVLLTPVNQPIRLISIISHLPPMEDYSDISQAKVELLDQNGQPTGFYFGPMTSCHEAPPTGEYDYGDAPDPTYHTLLANNGARHRIDPDIYLGYGVEADPDGQPSTDAQGDDNDGYDDEDGIVINSPLIPGTIASITVRASVQGLLYGWIDFQRDGLFDVATDHVFTGQVLSPGTNVLGIVIPSNAVTGTTYARFRFSRDSVLDPEGEAPNGEVEDYLVKIEEGDIKGSVKIIKEAIPADDTPFLFCANFNPGSFFNTLCEYLKDPSNNTWTFNNPDSLQQVNETTPTGWMLTDIVITGDTDNGSTIDLANAIVDLDYDEGENIIITFKNEKTEEAQYDYGDAPEGISGNKTNNYPTTLANNGARHKIVPGGPWIGDSAGMPDAEPDGQPSPGASGDGSDENSRDITWRMGRGVPSYIEFEVGVGGYVDIWIDFDGDGSWQHPGERVFSSMVGPGTNRAEFIVPGNSGPNQTYARIRINSQGSLSPSGPAADGEVEDHWVNIQSVDFGDAPDPPYPTLLSNNGAWKTLWKRSPFIGIISLPDGEAEGQTNPQALGDDSNNRDDEEGIQFLDPLIPGGQSTLRVTILNPAGHTGAFAGWIDFNQDGTWDDSQSSTERIIYYNISSGTYQTDLIFYVPSDAVPGSTFARFVITDGIPEPTGGNIDYGGEVEDYQIIIGSDGPYPAQKQHDFGDAPLPYPQASHELGGPYLGLFGDVPDAETGMQRDAQAMGDDSDANGDDENGLLSINLVKTPGVWSMLDFKGYFSNSSSAKCSMWIDYNGDGDWDDQNEHLPVTFGFCGFGAGPQDWFHVMYSFLMPAEAKVGTTYARLRVYDDCNDLVSVSGAAGPGEVEDYVVEIKADGTGVPPGGIVHGYKWNDLNGNGMWDIANTIEPPLSGWTFWLDINNNGQQDAGDMFEQTDSKGHFIFTGVPTGTYTLGEQLQSGWVQTAPGGNGTYSVNVQTGQGTLAYMFGNCSSDGPTYDGIICGSKWNDLNGDTISDVNEPYLANWEIYLDINRNDRLDPGEPSQLTDSSGNFEFTGLAAGSYIIAEVMQQGWQQTWPGSLQLPCGHEVAIQPGVQPACVMFGNQQTGTGLQYDWGDAPDANYGTLQSSNGASHVIVPGFCLGGHVDSEADGQPTNSALGDDYDGNDDEDGVFFITPLIPGHQAEVEIIASSEGYLDAWIDFDADGSWSEIYDHIFISEPVTNGSNILTFYVPAGTGIDIDTYSRFRLSSTGILSPSGQAQDGEVEDYHILIGENGPYVPGEQEIPHIIWSQPPIETDPNLNIPPVFCGWNESARSTEQSGQTRQWRMDADDFRCLGSMPITRIRWWGGFKGWEHPGPPESQPQAWHISIWVNQVDEIEESELFPERLVWSVEIPIDRVHFEPVGQTDFPQKQVEMCFVYEVNLTPEEWFDQDRFISNYDIFWISITAIYPTDAEQINMWGWMTRTHTWGNGAVIPGIFGDWPSYDEILFPGRIYPIENNLLCEQNHRYDLCFQLLTEQPWCVWDQPFTGVREWPDYTEEPCMALEPNENELIIVSQATDDWFCEHTEPITTIIWNGSYIGYGYEPNKCNEVIQPRKPDYFILTIRDNIFMEVEEDYNSPGEIIWQYEAFTYDEVMVGYDNNPQDEPNEPVFRYSVKLPPQAWFRQGIIEKIYWFSVVAVYNEPFAEIPYSWSWINHRHVFGSSFFESEEYIDFQWHLPFDSIVWPVDKSFMLLTGPELKPIAHWKFDEIEGSTAFDSAGSRHGQLYGGNWGDGVINGALEFNGVDNYVDCGDSNMLSPEKLTIALWLRPEGKDGIQYIVSKTQIQTENIDYAVVLRVDGKIEFVLSQIESKPISIVSQSQIPQNEWSHIALMSNNKQASIYINGSLDTISSVIPRTLYGGSRFVLGAFLGQSNFFKGKFDDVYIFDENLLNEQIIELITDLE